MIDICFYLNIHANNMASPSVQGSNLERFTDNIHTKNWRESINTQLQTRRFKEQTPFEELCSFANSMFDKVDICKSENLQLSLQREQLQQQLLGIQQTLLAGGSDAAKTIISKLANVSLNDGGDTASGSVASKNLGMQHASLLAEKTQLEKKILDLQEKLADALKARSDSVQKICDLKTELDEKDRSNRHLTATINQLMKENKELKEINAVLDNKLRTQTDEHLALTLSYKSLEKRHHALKLDNDAMSLQILNAKREDAERLNAENDRIIMLQRERDKRNIEANVAAMTREQAKKYAAGDKAAITLAAMAADNFEAIGDDDDLCIYNFPSKIPSVAEFMFEAHEGGSTTAHWYYCSGPRDNFLATGGQDRKVKIWKIAESEATMLGDALQGSNSSITSIDVEADSILASSCDMATRVWSLNSQRLNLTLTGHSAKVNSAKFVGDCKKIVSGSADRTVKLWDVIKGACVRTFFAGSNCFDLVYGNHQTISSHFDKKIRGWDFTLDKNDPAWVILLNEKVVSVDVSVDQNKLACCLKDNTIKCVDLRNNNIVFQTYTDEKFRVGDDSWKVSFSNDGQYISCGSCDGSVYIWDVNTAKVEKVLKGHGGKVIATCWAPDGRHMASIESGRKITIWA